MDPIDKGSTSRKKLPRLLLLLPLVALQFVIGIAALTRFSQHVRAVEAVGLSGGGAVIGVGLTLLGIVCGELYDGRRTR